MKIIFKENDKKIFEGDCSCNTKEFSYFATDKNSIIRVSLFGKDGDIIIEKMNLKGNKTHDKSRN